MDLYICICSYPFARNHQMYMLKMSRFILGSVSCGDNSIAHAVKRMFLDKRHIIMN